MSTLARNNMMRRANMEDEYVKVFVVETLPQSSGNFFMFF